MSHRCLDCQAPSEGTRCRPCWRLARLADAPVPKHGLPPRLPEPEGMPFCGCGAIRGLVPFRGDLRCADCLRGAA